MQILGIILQYNNGTGVNFYKLCCGFSVFIKQDPFISSNFRKKLSFFTTLLWLFCLNETKPSNKQKFQKKIVLFNWCCFYRNVEKGRSNFKSFFIEMLARPWTWPTTGLGCQSFSPQKKLSILTWTNNPWWPTSHSSPMQRW